MNYYVAILILVAFLGTLAFRLSLPAVAFYTRLSLHASAFGVGLLTSVFFLARAFTAIYSGGLADRFKTKVLYISASAFLLNSIATYSYSYARILPHVLLIRFIQGVLNGFGWVPIQVMVGLLVRKNIRGRIYSIYFISGSIGIIAGNLTYSILAYQPLNSILIIASIVFLITSLTIFAVAFRIKGVELYTYERRKSSVKQSGRMSIRDVFRIEIIILFLIVLCVGSFNSIARGDLIYIYMKEFFNLSKSLVAGYIALASLFGLAVGYLLSWLSDRYDEYTSLIIALLIYVLGALLLGVIIRYTAILSLALVYAGSSSIIPIVRKIGVSQRHGGTVIGFINASANIGNVLGSAIAGELYDILIPSISMFTVKYSTLILIMVSPLIAIAIISVFIRYRYIPHQ